MRYELIFEIGTEELPARFMPRALDDLAKYVREELDVLRLNDTNVVTMGTPRRLAVQIKGLPERQPDVVEESKGPAWSACFTGDGLPTRAAEGFAKSKGIEVGDLVKMQSGKAEYAFAKINRPGAKIEEILPQALLTALNRLVFPKNMYWAEPNVRFARPVRWLLCLLNDQVLPLSYNGLTADRYTRGHRFMGASKVEVAHAGDYASVLYDQFVIVDPLKRKEKMLSAIAVLERELGGKVELDPDLVEENLYLCEYPVPFLGRFDPRYLEVPEQVLITSMKANQKYFACRSAEGKLLPAFVAVSNNRPASMDKIREGNERVLKGRLDDAVFFWVEDQKTPLASKVELLKEVTYQEGLGSVYDKTRWIMEHVVKLCRLAGHDALVSTAERAGLLCKADLVTQMVGEFPELQGVMGRAYAVKSGESVEVAQAIEEHYLPRFAGDRLPLSECGGLLGLTERAFSLLGASKLGYQASSSQDPYGLRRAARCLNEIFWSNLKIDVDWKAFLEEAGSELGLSQEQLADLWGFIAARMLIQLKERGYDHKLAQMAVHHSGHRPYQVLKLLEALSEASCQEWFGTLVEASTRVKNLCAKAQFDGQVKLDEKLFQQEAEKELWQKMNQISAPFEQALEKAQWREAMKVLSGLAEPIKRFFDDVMVLADDEALRHNRLGLLSQCQNLFDKLGDLGVLKK